MDDVATHLLSMLGFQLLHRGRYYYILCGGSLAFHGVFLQFLVSNNHCTTISAS